MDHDQPLGDVTLCKSSEFLFFFDDDSTPRTPVTENAGSPGDDNDNLFEQTEEVLSVGVPSDLRLGTGCQEEALPVFRAVFERDDFDETTKFLDSAIDDDSDEPFLPDDLDSADKERSALPPLSPRDFLVASPSNEDAGMADCTSTSAEMSDDEIRTHAVEVQGSSVGLGGVEPVQEEQVMPCETETAAPGSSQPPRAGRAPRGGRSKRLNTERVVEALRKAFEHCARTTSSIVSPTGEERKLLRLETVSAEEMNADYNLTPTHVKPLKNERSGQKYLKKVRFEAADYAAICKEFNARVKQGRAKEEGLTSTINSTAARALNYHFGISAGEGRSKWGGGVWSFNYNKALKSFEEASKSNRRAAKAPASSRSRV